MVSSDGISYIKSIMVFSMIARSPLAPVFLVIDFSAMALIADSSNSNFTPSNSNSFSYCFTKEFFGSFKIRTRASLSNASKETITGTRPTNSGIIPNFTRSCGITSFNTSPIFRSFLSAISVLNPIDFVSIRVSIILFKPSNAPPQINKILLVSIWINSCCGCFLPP